MLFCQAFFLKLLFLAIFCPFINVTKEDQKRTILGFSNFWRTLKASNDFLLVGRCGIDALTHTKNSLVLISQLCGGQKRTK